MLTAETLSYLRAIESTWLREVPTKTGRRVEFQAALLKHAHDLLSAAEALISLREIDFHTATFEELGARTHELLEEIHMCGCRDDQNAMANSAPPTAGTRG